MEHGTILDSTDEPSSDETFGDTAICKSCNRMMPKTVFYLYIDSQILFENPNISKKIKEELWSLKDARRGD